MSMASPIGPRLCIFCRKLEQASEPCPYLQASLSKTGGFAFPTSPVAPLPASDGPLLKQLQVQPSAFCKRCADYDVLKVFEQSSPLDRTQTPWKADEWETYWARRISFELPLGPLSDLVLSASCPLCRLLYRVFPRDADAGIDPTNSIMRIFPLRIYTRNPGWEALPLDIRNSTAVVLGVRQDAFDIQVGHGFGLGEEVQMGEMTGEVIALSLLPPDAKFDGPRSYNARLVEPMIDFDLARRALDFCLEHHQDTCRVSQPDRLLTATMLDVIDRKTVPCPRDCDYVALSYVWGGVMPAADALEKHTLPETIEDAITVTRKLGRRYLWVDALCIDQSPDPTPEQWDKKLKQLQMMDLIYECATVTLVALAGSDSNAGLPGVSYPRVMQHAEPLNDGSDTVLFSVPPTMTTEIRSSVWDTRAWTLQESVMARRYLHFSTNQLDFTCQRASVSDADETATKGFMNNNNTPQNMDAIPPPHTGMAVLDDIFNLSSSSQPDTNPPKNKIDQTGHANAFRALLTNYTARSMTNPADSLNAFLGMLAVFERRIYKSSGFQWGLPLREHPRMLGWYHDQTVGPTSSVPRRRRDLFPSWSWAGWEGTVNFVDRLLEPSDQTPVSVGDLVPRFVGLNGKELTLEGWLVEMDVVTEPFSEAVIRKKGSEDGKKEEEEVEVLGIVKERNFTHNITLRTGRYACLVLERVTYLGDPNSVRIPRVYMLVLDWVKGRAGVAERQTLVTLTCEGDFMRLKPERRTLTLV